MAESDAALNAYVANRMLHRQSISQELPDSEQPVSEPKMAKRTTVKSPRNSFIKKAIVSSDEVLGPYMKSLEIADPEPYIGINEAQA